MQHFNIDNPLIDFSNSSASCHWTIRDSFEGTAIFGGIGSGKTSGPGYKLATKFLRNGYGALVLCAKNSEAGLWIKYCKQTGRLDDLIIVEPGGKHQFDFLAYELSLAVGGASLTENIAQVIKTVVRASEERSGGKGDDPFWENSLDQAITSVIDLAKLAYGKVTVKYLYDIITTAPAPGQQEEKKPRAGSYAHAFELAADKVSRQFEAFVRELSERSEAMPDDDELEQLFLETCPESATLKTVDHFFIEQYRTLSEKTRSIITMSFSGLLFRLMKEPVYSLLCRHESNFTPEDCYTKGKIIVLNLPVKHYHKVGRDSQILFKYIWQRAMERRNIAEYPRGVFLWADEVQNFLHEHDADFQSTARESRIATVCISQNLANYYANMGGGNRAEYKVKSLLSTLSTKIFNANADNADTNKYASELIGEAYMKEESRGTSIGEKVGMNYNESFKLVKVVRPEEFVKLKSGGPRNNFLVEAYMHCQGLEFPNGFHHQKIIFKQSK